jgi:hypothetical protein
MAKFQISGGYRLQMIDAPTQEAAEAVAVATSIGAGIREPELSYTTWARPARIAEMETLDIERQLRGMLKRNARNSWAAEAPIQIAIRMDELRKRRDQEAQGR